MIVKVRAFANFREIIGKEIGIELDSRKNVKDLLEVLCASHDQLYDMIFDESGKLRDDVILMKNRQNIESFDGIMTKIEKDDEIAIFPPVAGG